MTMRAGEVIAVTPPPGVARIQILHVPACPLVDRVRETVERVLARVGVPAELDELVGDYPSPTVLIDGRDVTGRPLGEGAACRLDFPTESQILAALERSPGENGAAEA
jgi:hypothetical protein